MVCYAIVACLRFSATKADSSGNFTEFRVFGFSFGKHCPEFREIAATIRLRSAGSRHATIAKIPF